MERNRKKYRIMLHITTVLHYYLTQALSTAVSAENMIFPTAFEVLGPFPSQFDGTSVSVFKDNTTSYISEYQQEQLIWIPITSFDNGTTGQVTSNINWQSLQKHFGPSIFNHRTFYQTKLIINESSTYLLQIDGADQFFIDGVQLIPNYYSHTTHVCENAIYLHEGGHTLNIITKYDINVLGISIPPLAQFRGTIRVVKGDESAVVYVQDTILPEIMDGLLVSTFASVSIRNPHIFPVSSGRKGDALDGSVSVEGVWVTDSQGLEVATKFTTINMLRIAPGHILSIPFEFNRNTSPFPEVIRISVDIRGPDSRVERFELGVFRLRTRIWNLGVAYKITFLGYDESVQQAILKSPLKPSLSRKFPVVVVLHEDGVGFDNHVFLSRVEAHDKAWIVYPSGRSNWANDWQGPPHFNVEALLDTLMGIPGVPNSQIELLQPDVDKRFYVGLYRGANAALKFASQYPDKTLAVLAISPLMNIPTSPFFEDMEPVAQGVKSYFMKIIDAAKADYDIGLHASNLAGIRILFRDSGDHESFYSRNLFRQITEWNHGEKFALYVTY